VDALTSSIPYPPISSLSFGSCFWYYVISYVPIFSAFPFHACWPELRDWRFADCLNIVQSVAAVLCGHCYNCLCSQRVCFTIYSYIPNAIWVVDIGVLSVRLWRCLGLCLSFLMPISPVVSVRSLYTYLCIHILHIWARGNPRHVSFSYVQSHVQSVCSFDIESKGASTSSTLSEMVLHIC